MMTELLLIVRKKPCRRRLVPVTQPFGLKALLHYNKG